MGADIKFGLDEGTNLYPSDILILDEVCLDLPAEIVHNSGSSVG